MKSIRYVPFVLLFCFACAFGAQSTTQDKAPAWRYQPQATNTTDTRTTADIATEDAAYDSGFGGSDPIDKPQTERRYSSIGGDVDSDDFPQHYPTGEIVIAHFTSWTTYLTKSRRSVYTVVNLEIDRVISDRVGQLSKGSTIPLSIPGGTVVFPGTGQVISYGITRYSFPCEPNTQYLKFLSYWPQSLPYYVFGKSWKVDNGILRPTSHFDIDRAARGEKSHAGASLEAAINEILAH